MFPSFLKTKEPSTPRPHTTAVIVAAGSSTRMGGVNKLLLPINDVPVLARTLLTFAQCAVIDDMVLVCREQDFSDYYALIATYEIEKVRTLVVGGQTRAHSVQIGVQACEDAQIVAIHDGARPLVSECIITQCVEMAIKNGASAPVVAMKDSVKKVRHGIIEADVPRDKICAVQTPQTFRRDLILTALDQAIAEQAPLTDDCSALERMGLLVHAVEGDYRNIKVTTPEDVTIAQAILQALEEEI